MAKVLVTVMMLLAVIASSLYPRASYAVTVYKVQNLATRYCLDSNANGQVYTLTCNGGDYQFWTITPSGDGTVILKNWKTKYCLDSNANRQVYTLTCNGGDYQRWFYDNSSGYVTLKNWKTEYCLDSNANRQVYTLTCNGGSYQFWY